jgi:hypothetical protein
VLVTPQDLEFALLSPAGLVLVDMGNKALQVKWYIYVYIYIYTYIYATVQHSYLLKQYYNITYFTQDKILSWVKYMFYVS